jgi:hypothetical protein
VFNLLSRLQTGRVIDGMMLLMEIRDDCYLICRVSDPHPRPVYYVHVTWDNEADRWDVTIPAQEESNQ